MSTDKVTIGMELDRSQVHAEAKAHVADMERMKASSKEAEKAIIGADGKARDAQGRFVAVGKSGTEAFASIGLGALGAVASIKTAISAAVELDAAMKRISERQAERAGAFNANRAKLGELAGQINNGVNDDAFALSQAKFARDAMLTQSQALAFRKSFNDSGAQFVGKTMPAEESRKFEAKSAKLAAAMGIDPSLVGEFMGTVSGVKQFKNADEALGGGYSSMAILQAGSGDTGHLIKENKKLLASLYTDDETKSVASSTDEVAALVSAAAEFAPGQESENARAAVRALRDFTSPKTGPLLKEAKITAQDSPTAAIAKLKKVVDEKAKTQKVKPLDVLGATIEDITGATALAGYMNKGVTDEPTQGIFAARAQTAKESGTEGAMKRIGGFEFGSAGLDMATIVNKEFTETSLGAQNAAVDIARKAAKAKLTAEGKLDTPAAEFIDKLSGWIPFKDIGSNDLTIDEEARSMLRRAAPRSVFNPAGIAAKQLAGRDDMANYGYQRSDELRDLIGDINSAGGNALGAMVTEMQKQTAELEKVTAAITKQGEVKTPPPIPAPLPPPPPPIRRP